MSLRHIGLAVAIIVLTVGIGCEGAQPTPALVSPAATPSRPMATPVSEATPPTATAPPPTATPKPPIQAIVPEMVLVEPGSFQMGSADGGANEQPVHTVHITRPFYISKYEVTYEQYDQFCDDTVGQNRPRSSGERGNRPVAGINWYDAVEYCNWLSEKEGLTPCYSGKGRLTQCDFTANGYRLPTEAEWEYAARGGHLSQGFEYAGSDNPDDVAWYDANSGNQVHPVGQKQPNELGLYDMSGNALEYCWDWYVETHYATSPASDPTGPLSAPRTRYEPEKVRRGGNWREDVNFCRVACRSFDGVSYRGDTGFRLVRTKEATPTLTGSGGGMIAFASDRDNGDWEIYVMNANGSDQRRLTNQRFADWRHSWSPDGTQLAFTSRRKGSEDIYVMNADGSDPQRLTTNHANDFLPTWSPDGTQIAFVSDRDRNTEIYVMNADGSDQRRLTHNTVDDGDPAWSPASPGGGTSGTQIAFVSGRDGNDEIYLTNADGAEQGSGDPRRLTHNDVDDWSPAWSPDGTQIAFTSARDGSYEIYVMSVPDGTDADGSNPRRLTHGDGDAWCPSWSPDGTQIAFQSNPDGQWDIYVMDADGTNVRRLTTSSAADRQPAWRP